MTNLKELISESLNDKSKMISLSLNKDLRNQIEKETSWMDGFYQKIPLKIRCLSIHLDYNEKTFPKCPVCSNPVSFKKDSHDGFNLYCSEKCHQEYKKRNKIIHNHPLLSDENWLYQERIIKRKSKEQIANELGISITPINEAIKLHNIEELKLNESNESILSYLKNKEWLIEQHVNNHLTLSEIANELGSTKATVSRWLAIHGIEANNSNSYDRPFVRNSKGCQEIIDFLNDNEIQHQLNNRTILNGKEIDIWIPDHELAIEYNGLFWHSFYPHSDKESIKKDRDYHSFKTQQCLEKGIQLIHIWEDDWRDKKEIWKSRLLQLVHQTQNKISARNCQVKLLTKYEKSDFLKLNHIQGNDHSMINLGLILENKIVSVMTFCKSRYNQNYKWELSRFCSLTNHNIQGGFSKLLSYFRSHYKESIVSYADKNLSTGSVYIKNGFKKISETNSNYWYVDLKKGIKIHRSALMKKRVSPNDKRTENEILEELGYRKIFGSGLITFGI